MDLELQHYQPDMFGYENPTAGDELLRATPPAHTGERVERDWERCMAILEAYASGESIRSICRRHSIGHNTLSRLVERNAKLVDTAKRRVSGQLRRVSGLLLDRMEMEAHLIPTNQLGVNLGIVLDKLQMVETASAAGETDQKDPALSVDTLAARLERMKRAAVVEVVTVPPTDAPSAENAQDSE